LTNILLFMDDLTSELWNFFSEIDENGKANLNINFFYGREPWTLFGDVKKPKKNGNAKKTQKKKLKPKTAEA
jgi:hypothetical protein